MEEDGYDDEYQLEDLEVTPADYVKPIVVTNFRNSWWAGGGERREGRREGMLEKGAEGRGGVSWRRGGEGSVLRAPSLPLAALTYQALHG